MNTEIKTDGRTLRVKRTVTYTINGKQTEIKTRANAQFFVRVSPEVKELISKKAKSQGKGLTEFVLERMEEVLANPDSITPKRGVDYGKIKGLTKNEQSKLVGKIPDWLKAKIEDLAVAKGVDKTKLILCSLLPMISE